MEISRPQPGDVEAVRDVVARSMRASYAMSPDAIAGLLASSFDETRLSSAFDGDDGQYLVARRSDTDDRGVVGYAEGRVDEATDVGVVEWLHVDPQARGQDVGTELFERLRESLVEHGPDEIQARLLADSVEGKGFFEHMGMAVVDDETFEIDGQEHTVEVYAEASAVDGDSSRTAGTDAPEDSPMGAVPEGAVEGADVDPAALPGTVDSPEGSLYVDQEETRSGSSGPFLLVYRHADREDLFGYYCGHCGTLVEAMDGLGRLTCEECGNVHRPDDWDDSYL